MTYGEKRIHIILTNYALGKYDLAYLKDLLARGPQHVEERSVTGGPPVHRKPRCA